MIGSASCNWVRASVWLGLILFPLLSFGQASFEAQVRGAVRDSSGSLIIGARVTITDVATNISSATSTDERGYFIFNGLQHDVEVVRIQGCGNDSGKFAVEARQRPTDDHDECPE
jgi:hypothetical protein